MSAPAGIFDTFTKLIKITSRDNQKNVLFYLTSSISELKLRLEEIRRRLKERDDELLTNAVKALNYNDRDRASIYASEIIEVRRLIKIINVALLAIERLLERLKTMDIVSDMKKPMSLALGILSELKHMFTNTMPELATAVDAIVSNVNTLVTSTQTPETDVNIIVKTKEVEEIIKEAEMKAEENMRSSLQPLPIQLKNIIDVVSSNVTSQLRKEEAFISNRSSATLSIPTSYVKLNNIDMTIYQIILKNNGIIDINECAKILGIPRDEVLRSLKRLEQMGWIKIA